MAETAPAPVPSTRTGRLLSRLDRSADRRWFLPAVGAFPLGDYVLPVLPGQLLLAGLAALHPRRWWPLVLTFVTGSVLGALLTALAVRAAGDRLLRVAGQLAPDRAEFQQAAELVAQHGPWVLAALSMLPFTPRTAVLACALAGVEPLTIALAVLAGRPVPLVLIGLAGARAPRLLRRSRRVDRVLAEVAAGRTAPEPSGTAGQDPAAERVGVPGGLR
ncbi:VTT domain-containing protein [Streptomyces sp. NPDC002454]|uniref:VTT domain-containing protein n=1 Tax=Streptomyces sp. NPDC049906 TaxID=3155656 RepID=UPI00343745D1